MSYHGPSQTMHDGAVNASRSTRGHYSISGMGEGPRLLDPVLGALTMDELRHRQILQPSVVDEFNATLARKIAPFAGLIQNTPGLTQAQKTALLTRPFDFLVDLFDPAEHTIALSIRDYIAKTGKTSVVMPFINKRVDFVGASINNATGKLNVLSGDAQMERVNPALMNLVRRLRVIAAFMAITYTDPLGFIAAQSLWPDRNDFGSLHSLIPNEVPANAVIRSHRVSPNDSAAALERDGWDPVNFFPAKNVATDPLKPRVELWMYSGKINNVGATNRPVTDQRFWLFYYDKLDEFRRDAELRRLAEALLAPSKVIANRVYGGSMAPIAPVVTPPLVLAPRLTLRGLGSLGLVGVDDVAAGGAIAGGGAVDATAGVGIVDGILKTIEMIIKVMTTMQKLSAATTDLQATFFPGGGGGGDKAPPAETLPSKDIPPNDGGGFVAPAESGMPTIAIVGTAAALAFVYLSTRRK